MTELTSALVCGGALSMLFKNTCAIGIACITGLCVLYPLLVFPVFIGIALFVYHKHLYR
jgi:hypothetical protein